MAKGKTKRAAVKRARQVPLAQALADDLLAQLERGKRALDDLESIIAERKSEGLPQVIREIALTGFMRERDRRWAAMIFTAVAQQRGSVDAVSAGIDLADRLMAALDAPKPIETIDLTKPDAAS